MGDVLACRICLSTEKKLYNIFKYKLVEAYEVVSQIVIQQTDQLPHFVCSICSKLLNKYAEFNALCDISNNLLLQELQKKQQLSTKDVETIESKYNIVNLTLTKLPNISFSDDNIKEECETHDGVYVKEYKIEHLDIIDENIYERNLTNYENTTFLYTTDTVEVQNDNNYENFNKKTIFNGKAINTEDLDENLKEISKFRNNFDENEAVNDIYGNHEEVNDIFCESEEVNDKFIKNDECEYLIQRNESDVHKSKLDHEIDSEEEPLSKVVKKTLKFLKKDKISLKLVKKNKNTLKSHKQNSLSSGSFTCDICHIRFLNVRRLRTHIGSSHQRNYICRKCAHVSKTTNKAREHYDWHQGKKFECKICDSVFNKSTSYYSHIRIHHPTENCCTICGEAFIGPVGLLLHVKKSHRNGANTKKAKSNFCKKCKVNFRHEEAYNNHIEHCQDNNKPCAHCGESFQNEVILKEHLRTHRNKKDRQFSCKQCHKTFTSFSQSRLCHKKKVNHSTRDVARGTFICEYCGKAFDVQSKLKLHQHVHNRTKSFQCMQCLKYYTTMEGLKIHTRTHTKERPFKCEVCPKDFVHKAALNRHARVHTGSKPYTCHYCGKSFSQSNSMKVHIKTVHFKMPAPYRNKKIDKNECNVLLTQ